MTSKPIYYVYAYLREDGTPYYIGKGKGNRAYSKSHNVKVPTNLSRIIFLETNLTNVGACALERRMIRWYGRKIDGSGILRNIAPGGECTEGIFTAKDIAGNVFSCNVNDIKYLSGEYVGVNKGRPAHTNTIAAGKARLGIPKSKEHKQAISLALSGTVMVREIGTQNYKRVPVGNIPDGYEHIQSGRILSQESKDKNSKAHKGLVSVFDTQTQNKCKVPLDVFNQEKNTRYFAIKKAKNLGLF